MFEKKKKIELSNEELRIMRYSLIDFRNDLLKENKYTDPVNEVMIKLKNKMKVDKYDLGVMINSLDKTIDNSPENPNTFAMSELLVKLYETYKSL